MQISREKTAWKSTTPIPEPTTIIPKDAASGLLGSDPYSYLNRIPPEKRITGRRESGKSQMTVTRLQAVARVVT
jgi:hypothetical protein